VQGLELVQELGQGQAGAREHQVEVLEQAGEREHQVEALEQERDRVEVLVPVLVLEKGFHP